MEVISLDEVNETLVNRRCFVCNEVTFTGQDLRIFRRMRRIEKIGAFLARIFPWVKIGKVHLHINNGSVTVRKVL